MFRGGFGRDLEAFRQDDVLLPLLWLLFPGGANRPSDLDNPLLEDGAAEAEEPELAPLQARALVIEVVCLGARFPYSYGWLPCPPRAQGEVACLDVDASDEIRVAKFCKHLLRGRHCCRLGPQRQISGARYHPFLHGPLLRHDEADPLAVHGSRRCVRALRPSDGLGLGRCGSCPFLSLLL